MIAEGHLNFHLLASRDGRFFDVPHAIQWVLDGQQWIDLRDSLKEKKLTGLEKSLLAG